MAGKARVVFKLVSPVLMAPSTGDMTYPCSMPRKLKGQAILVWLCLISQTVTADTFSMVYVSVFSEATEMVRPAIDMAVEQFMADGGLQGHRVKYYMVQTSRQCSSELEAMDQIVKHLLGGTMDVMFGSACSSVTAPAAWTLHHWNIPILSEGAISDDMGDKERHPNLVRLNAPYDRMGPACVEIMQAFSWDRAAVLSMDFDICEFGALSINNYFPEANLILTEWIRYAEDFKPNAAQLDQYLQKLRQRARIIWFCMEMGDIIQLMLRAHALGMTNGDYVFLYYGVDLGYRSFWETWYYPLTGLHLLSEEEKQERREAFYPFKQVTLAGLNGPEIDQFRLEVALRMRDVYNNSFSWDMYQAGWLWSVFLYDAVYLYMDMINETLSDGGNPRNGSALFNKACNREFEGKSGHVVLDDRADRDPDYVMFYNGPSVDIQTQGMLLTMSEAPGSRVTYLDDIYWGTADNQPPPSVPPCGFNMEFCPEDNTAQITLLVVILTFVVVIALALGALVTWRRRVAFEKEIQEMLWKVDFKSITHVTATVNSVSTMASLRRQSLYSIDTTHDDGQPISTDVAFYMARKVALRKVHKANVVFSREDLLELAKLRDMNHENLNSFIGACTEAPNIYILTQYCSKGKLCDLLYNDEIKLDWDFKCSLINDVISGMAYIHGSFLHSHGHLTSNTCLVDSRWQVKITSFGLRAFKQDEDRQQLETEIANKLLWTAPELLRMPPEERPFYGTQAGDVYSFAILTQEIVYREMPYFMEGTCPTEIMKAVSKTQPETAYRPSIPLGRESRVPEDMVLMVKACWDEVPERRPDFGTIRKTFKNIHSVSNINIMDNMLKKLEKYAGNLEEIVQQRTQQLIVEKRKTESLLYKMLPHTVADVLKRGLSVTPEIFDEVTIYFSDIVGFTSLSSESTPIQVVDVLNDLYTLFDDIIECYDVYKVETIGDAYMVASGLPQRNGSRHATEIASMSLHLLSAVYTQFRIRHRPKDRLRLRIGLHTGSCAAGVVGLTMPRYCLFGDTVNMASRMESSGEPFRIHISSDCHAVLENLEGYAMKERGDIQIKGKGLQKTYWLVGKSQFARPLPDFLQE